MDYEQLRKRIDGKLAVNPEFRSIVRRISSGTATFADTSKYAQILSSTIGNELSANVLELSDREQITQQLLRYGYKDINEVCARVQSSLDASLGVSIRPQTADFPEERVQQFSHSLVDPTVEDSVIQRRAKNGTANITMSFHDDYIEKNAKFRNDAGLNCYIERIGSDCCEWCTEVAGKYLFGTQPKDIFRRHDKCDCVIIYDNKVLRGKKNAKGESTKTWEEVPDTERADYTPERISRQQAEKLQNQKLSQIRGLRVDNSGRSGIIESEQRHSELGQFKRRIRNDNRVSEEYYSAIKNRFSHGSDVAKAAFNQYVPDDSVIDSSYEGIAAYNPDTKKIQMHYEADLSNDRGAGATWFHEHGHLIDDAAGMISDNPEYFNILKDDYEIYIKNYISQHGVSLQQAYNDIGSELSEMRKHSAVSDLINALSGDKIRGVAWHPPNYWKNNALISSEAFAHMFEAQFDSIRYQQMKKMFPNSLLFFENMLKGAIK